MPASRSLPVVDAVASALAPLGAAEPLSRRGFLTAGACSLVGVALVACGGGGDAGLGPTQDGSIPSGVVVAGSTITVPLASAPSLGTARGFLLLTAQDAHTIVINTGDGAAGPYRAFTSICTHQACDVAGFDGSRIRCPCHGSQYDASGKPVAGPAPSALREYAVSLDAAAGTLTVTKA